MFEYSRPTLGKYSDVRTSKKSERQWSHQSLFCHTFFFYLNQLFTKKYFVLIACYSQGFQAANVAGNSM